PSVSALAVAASPTVLPETVALAAGAVTLMVGAPGGGAAVPDSARTKSSVCTVPLAALTWESDTFAASAGGGDVALSCCQAALAGASASHTKLVLPVVLVYMSSSEVATLPMYQSDAAYFVFGLTVIGALIHFASPEDSAVTVMPRLCVPV